MMTLEIKINDRRIFKVDIVQTGITEGRKDSSSQPRLYKAHCEWFSGLSGKRCGRCNFGNIYHDRIDGAGRLAEIVLAKARAFCEI